MNLYTRTMVFGLICFLLTITLIITLKPVPYDSSSEFLSQSRLNAPSGKNISDAELTGFLNASSAITMLKEYLREQLFSIMDEHGMTKQRYNQIAAMENDPDISSDATEIERETARIISQKIAELEFEIQQQAFSIINEHKFTADRFMEITERLSKDPVLRRRFEKLTQSYKHSRKITREFSFRFCSIGQSTAIQTVPPFCAVWASA